MSTTSYDRKWYAQLVGIFTSFSYTFDKKGHLFLLLQTLANKSLDKELSEREYQLYKITAQLLGQPLYQKNENAIKLLLNTYSTFVKQVNEKADRDWLELCRTTFLSPVWSLPAEDKAPQQTPTKEKPPTSLPSIGENKRQRTSSTSPTAGEDLTLGKDSSAVKRNQRSSTSLSTTNESNPRFFSLRNFRSVTTLASFSETDSLDLPDDNTPDVF